MRRGGCVILQVSELLQGAAFPDLSLSALGAWVCLKAAEELTGEGIGPRQMERLGIGAEVLAELSASGLATCTADHWTAAGMPEPAGKPSDAPEAVRERQEASRLGISVAELRSRKNPPAPPVSSESDQVRSGVTPSRVTTRDEALPTNAVVVATDDDETEADRAYLRAHRLCLRCRQPGYEGNPITSAGRHRFADCRERLAV
jgi:hypothetical protein